MSKRREVDRQIIESLLGSLERSFSLSMAQKAVLTGIGSPDWESRVLIEQAAILKKFRADFLRFRGILAPPSSGSSMPAEWRQIVQQLIESVNDLDPDE